MPNNTVTFARIQGTNTYAVLQKKPDTTDFSGTYTQITTPAFTKQEFTKDILNAHVQEPSIPPKQNTKIIYAIAVGTMTSLQHAVFHAIKSALEKNMYTVDCEETARINIQEYTGNRSSFMYVL
jgi:hypothetical protein